jgi:hypothetical protein
MKMIKLTNEVKYTAEYTPIAVAEDGKRFVFLCDAFWNGDFYRARAFCPDDTPDEDGDRPVYNIHFEIINPECADESNACDWESVYDYKENGDYIEGDVVAVLMELVCMEYSERA